jgi:hypothetical protein
MPLPLSLPSPSPSSFPRARGTTRRRTLLARYLHYTTLHATPPCACTCVRICTIYPIYPPHRHDPIPFDPLSSNRRAVFYIEHERAPSFIHIHAHTQFLNSDGCVCRFWMQVEAFLCMNICLYIAGRKMTESEELYLDFWLYLYRYSDAKTPLAITRKITHMCITYSTPLYVTLVSVQVSWD